MSEAKRTDSFNRRKFLWRMAGGAAAATPLLVVSRGDSPAESQTGCIVPTPSDTVVNEQNLSGQPANPGAAATHARGDHTHGTPRPREPQTGTHQVGLVSGDTLGARLELGSDRSGGDYNPGWLRATGGGSELELAGPIAANGWGRPVHELYGYSDGTCVQKFYNDLDVNLDSRSNNRTEISGGRR